MFTSSSDLPLTTIRTGRLCQQELALPSKGTRRPQSKKGCHDEAAGNPRRAGQAKDSSVAIVEDEYAADEAAEEVQELEAADAETLDACPEASG